MWLSVFVLLVLFYVPALARAAIAWLVGMRVARVMLGFGPKLATWTIGRTRWQLHAIPIATFSQIAGLHATDTPIARGATDAFDGRPRSAQLLVLLAGVIGLFVFATAVCVAGNLAFGIMETDASRVLVDTVLPGSPAAAAGLLGEDEIVAVEGAPIDGMKALAPALDATHGPVRLTIRRERAEQTIIVTPQDVGGERRIGVTLMTGEVVRRVGPWRAIADGALFPARYARYAGAQLGRDLIGKRPTKNDESQIGVMRLVSRAQRGGPRMIVGAAVAIAIQFALWLLVPVPPTDGARVLWWIFRKRTAPLAAAVEAGIVAPTKVRSNAPFIAMVTLVGMIAAMLLFAAGTGLVVAVVFVALLQRRPWGWALTRTFAPYLVGAALYSLMGRYDAGELLRFALFLAIALLARVPSVRLLFGLRCPVCGAVAGEPVLGAQRALQCRACGSSWAVALPTPPSGSSA